LEAWCARRPLLGRRFMITRAFEQQQPLNERLSHLGARTVCLAVNGFTAIANTSTHRMYGTLNQYDWIILTSVNAVHFFLKGLEQHGGGVTDLDTLKIACVGPVTAAAVKAAGLDVALEPTIFTSEGLLKAFAQTSVKGTRILLPRAQIARPILPDALRSLHAQVDVVATYEKRSLTCDKEFWQQVNALALDGVLFCASSAVGDLENWIDTAEEDSFKNSVSAFCIGPSTSETAKLMGYVHVATATEHTVTGLVDYIAQYYLAPS
jgi:uroporphyrinogen III methyltransferase / synthase